MQDGRPIYFILFIIQMHSVVNKISQTTNSHHVPFFPKQHEGAKKNKPQLSCSLDHELG